ncbi:TPA: site-specific integrase, partial [Klebsiella pneumoniae]|nr:site-specific integrase [Klebsiella pneumoniae]
MIQNKKSDIQYNQNHQMAINSHYKFLKTDEIWVLDKDIKINILLVLNILNQTHHKSFIDTLACFAATRSSSYTKNLFFAFSDYIKTTENGIITEKNLEEYFNKYSKNKNDFMVSMRAFFSKWYKLGCEGVTENHLHILYKGKLKKRNLGEMVKIKDPHKGPLSENDIILFNEGAIWLYEERNITLEQLTIALLTSYTGRRPIQTTHLKLKDISSLFGNNKSKFFINYPRAKHSGGFRTEFTKLKITEDLNDLISKLAEKNLSYFE